MSKPMRTEHRSLIINGLLTCCLLASTEAFSQDWWESIDREAFKSLEDGPFDSPVRDPGEGSMSDGRYFITTREVELHRVYDKKKAFQFGRYWALEPFEGDKDQYRRDYVMCKESNLMEYSTTCTLPKGVIVFIGPGQSMVCKNRYGPEYEMKASPIPQVYVPNAGDVCR